MIDLSQWRASIGLWNSCKGSFTAYKIAKESKLGISTLKEAAPKLMSAALALSTVHFLFTLHVVVNFILLMGIIAHCFLSDIGLFECTTGFVSTDMSWLHSNVLSGAYICSVSINTALYFILLLVLLLSGDVEINPGPTIDDKPDISSLCQWLEPLVDWQSFGLLLPGITQQDIRTIEDFESDIEKSKFGLYSKWLIKNPTGKWKDVLGALTARKEDKLAQAVRYHLQGNPKEILQRYCYELTNKLAVDLDRVTDALYAKELITQQTKDEMHVLGTTDYKKSCKLFTDIMRQLESSCNFNQYLINICHVFIKHQALEEIASSILEKLVEPVPGRDTVISPPDDVRKYADYMRKRYKSQPIVAEDWPPRVGQDFFGRLALVEKQDSNNETSNSAWYQLRGQVDKVIDASGSKEISVEDILKPVSDTALSLRIVIDGPPGIGKTTLCHKLLNMWSIGTLPHCQHDLVLYCPLRNRKIATATTLADLFECQRYEVPKVVNWFEEKNGEGLLIIFDGWDELSTHLRKSSIAAEVIHRNKLDQCSVIVTSRSYASSSLKVSFIKHVQVIGFTQAEIFEVIIQTLQEDPQLAKELIEAFKEKDSNVFELSHNFEKATNAESIELEDFERIIQNINFLNFNNIKIVEENSNDIEVKNKNWQRLLKNENSQMAMNLVNDLKVRGDVQSLCYIPLICSMVILVYRKERHLPATLTQLYENFILQTIKRHVHRHDDIDPYTLDSLSSLPSQLIEPLQELCRLAYTNLTDARMTFSSQQLQDQSLSEVNCFGLMTTFTKYDEKMHQFLHLSVQEFLAAWWITNRENTKEIFEKQFKNDHFRMCLRFVAGLTHLEHESYQQYFDKQLDLKCKIQPWHPNDYQAKTLCKLYHNPIVMSRRCHSSYNFSILLQIQLLYESQNTMLCHVLANSICQHSLCLQGAFYSLFDWLCFSYFLINSNIAWNHLHLVPLYDHASSIFTDKLASQSLQTQCRILEISFREPTNDTLHKFLHSSFLCNIQECYCELSNGTFEHCPVLLQFLNLPHVKVLHLTFEAADNPCNADECIEIEKCIELKSTLKELKIDCNLGSGNSIIVSVIRGVTKNNKMTSFMLNLSINDDDAPPPPIPNEVLQQLLKDNYTLKALSLIIPDRLLHGPFFTEMNTPLTALEIRIGYEYYTQLALAFFFQIDELRELFEKALLPINESYFPVHFIFYPSLPSLISPETKAESAMEVYATLQIGTFATTVKFKDGKAVYDGLLIKINFSS